MCHWCLYKLSVKLFEHEHILTAQFYCPVRSFDEKNYICHTFYKHLSKNEMLFQAVFKKMSVDPIPDELKDLKILGKAFIRKISRMIILKKKIHGKGELAKVKDSICNIHIEASNICNILPEPADSNGLIVVKSKRDFKYRDYVYYDPVCPNVIFQALSYLKIRNKFYEDISNA